MAFFARIFFARSQFASDFFARTLFASFLFARTLFASNFFCLNLFASGIFCQDFFHIVANFFHVKNSKFLFGKCSVDGAIDPFDEFSITALCTAFDFHAFYKVTRFKGHCFLRTFQRPKPIAASKFIKKS